MGYNIRPGLVEENASTLAVIKDSLESEGEARFKVSPQDLYSEQYRLRRILVATEVLHHECGGDFADMGQKVTVSVDRERGHVVVALKSHLRELELAKIDERDALKRLETYDGDMILLEFYPSMMFEEDQFARICRSKGWKVHTQALEKEEDGKWRLPAERISAGEAIDEELEALGD